jgi:hypothetical protein
MGIQYFDSLSEEILMPLFKGTDSSVSTLTIILKGFVQHPDRHYLTFTQYSIKS